MEPTETADIGIRAVLEARQTNCRARFVCRGCSGCFRTVRWRTDRRPRLHHDRVDGHPALV